MARDQVTIMSDSNKPHAFGALLLLAAAAAWLASLFVPDYAWPAAAAILVLASALIIPIGIHAFLAVAVVTAAHFVTLVPPPYGRTELPPDFMLHFVVLPLTIAAGAVAVWYWHERRRV